MTYTVLCSGFVLTKDSVPSKNKRNKYIITMADTTCSVESKTTTLLKVPYTKERHLKIAKLLLGGATEKTKERVKGHKINISVFGYTDLEGNFHLALGDNIQVLPTAACVNIVLIFFSLEQGFQQIVEDVAKDVALEI